jgi:hypothetical protein
MISLVLLEKTSKFSKCFVCMPNMYPYLWNYAKFEAKNGHFSVVY